LARLNALRCTDVSGVPNMSKETYICQKRLEYIKRDLQKKPTDWALMHPPQCTNDRKNLYTSKETNIDPKTQKRDLRLRIFLEKETV